MKKDPGYLLILGITAAAGAAAGMISNRRHTAQGGLIGAASGLLAGAVTAELYRRKRLYDSIDFYSSSSELYRGPEEQDDYCCR